MVYLAKPLEEDTSPFERVKMYGQSLIDLTSDT